MLDNCFENRIKNQREKLLNRVDIYGLYFQGGGSTIKYMPLLNILSGGGVPTCVSPKYCVIYKSYHMWSQEVC